MPSEIFVFFVQVTSWRGFESQSQLCYCASIFKSMDVEKIIAEIESLERIFRLQDTRPLQLADRSAANQRHDDVYANNPWFRLWKQYGIPR